MHKESEIFQKGNPWQKKVYRKMASFLEANSEIKFFGQSANGNKYKHLLTVAQSQFNFITEEIHTATKERFSKHKAGNLHRILTNTAASQPYCFNLIIYLQQNSSLADKLFSNLLEKQVRVHHLEPEFTPNFCDNIIGFERTGDESIGDQNLKIGSGTDSDIAVFYTYDKDKKGLLLIEFKFIEAEFSVCSSYAGKKQVKSICDSGNYFVDMIENKKTDKANKILCGYNRYFNWQLTAKSKVIDGEKVKSMSACPFRFGLNQLWRNMILAEQVALSRQCDEFGFWVFSPIENDNYLWKNGTTERQFREILTQQGNTHFKKVHLENILDKLHDMVTEEQENVWLKKMEKKYRIS